MITLITAFRTIFFYVGFAIIIAVFGTLSCLLGLLPLSSKQHQNVITCGNALVMLWLRLTCGVKLKLEGLENLPTSPSVILSNHESTWETFFLQRLLRPVSTTLKKELLYLPFFGWGLYFMKPIAIDRGSPKAALKKVQTMGVQRLTEGNNVLIFPEGTRHKQGEKVTYARSGASMAITAQVPVIPIAHNGSSCWPSDGYLKRPGTIHVIIGKPLSTVDTNSRQLTEQVQQWIEQQRSQMPS